MKKNIDWKVSAFDELSAEELYHILHLRTDVFVMEQQCPYQDMDFKDQKAIHLHGYIEGKLAAYARVFRSGDYFDEASAGRVIIAKAYRASGYGHDLMVKVLEVIHELLGEKSVTISAQAHLEHFYNTHGFFKVGEPYNEDGIPHIKMKRK